MATDTTIDAAAARPVQRDRAATVTMTRNADGMPEAQADMSFWDVLDVVNPLQHIPIVNSIYRAVTGDEINAPARVMGGILFGGVIGGAAAIANAVLEQSTGHDLGGHMLASLGFEDKPAAAGGAVVAEAAPQGQAQGATATAPGAAAAAAPATPQAAAVAANAALRPTASAVPPSTVAPPTLPPDAAARLQTAAAAGGLPLRDALASPTGDHRPSKMPARDTIPANTMQAKQAAALANQQRFARLGETPATAKPTASAAPPQSTPAAGTAPAAAAQQAAEASATPAPAAQAATTQAAGAPNGMPPAMLPDVMMRNLAKYEAARRAAAAKTGPGTRVDG